MAVNFAAREKVIIDECELTLSLKSRMDAVPYPTSAVIVVSGISEKTHDETVQDYFESKRRGGPIIKFTRSGSTANITFKDPSGM